MPYATLVIAKQNSNQIGIPTDFVSHAWRNSFTNFVAALEIEAAARNESNRFYWNDVFVEDQVDADKKPEDYFHCYTLKSHTKVKIQKL